MRVRLGDPMRAKHLKAALEDLAEEGVTQVFRPQLGAEWIVGVVGQLQFDVLQTRLDTEYNLPIGFEAAPYVTARWCAADDPRELDRFLQAKRAALRRIVTAIPSTWRATAGTSAGCRRISRRFVSRRPVSATDIQRTPGRTRSIVCQTCFH